MNFQENLYLHTFMKYTYYSCFSAWNHRAIQYNNTSLLPQTHLLTQHSTTIESLFKIVFICTITDFLFITVLTTQEVKLELTQCHWKQLGQQGWHLGTKGLTKTGQATLMSGFLETFTSGLWPIQKKKAWVSLRQQLGNRLFLWYTELMLLFNHRALALQNNKSFSLRKIKGGTGLEPKTGEYNWM